MIIKLGWATVTDITEIVDEEEQVFNCYVDAKIKRIGDEFRAMNYVNENCIMLQKKIQSFNLKIPLSCVVYYKGFKALVIAKPPYEQNLVYGPWIEDGQFKEYKKKKDVENCLSQLSDTLNIKPHKFSWNKDERPIDIHVTFMTEVHRSKGFEDIKELLKDFQTEYVDVNQSLKVDDLYLQNLADVLPYNYGLEILFSREDNHLPLRRFRPEFLRTLESSLNPDVFDNQYEQIDQQTDYLELAEAAKLLKDRCLQDLEQMFDGLDIIPIDSYTLRQAMHNAGVNLRYMGEIASQTQYPHIKQIILQDMIGRVLKKIFRQHLAEYIMQ